MNGYIIMIVFARPLIAFSLLFSFTSLAQTHLITDISGYSINDGQLVEFSAMTFDDDRVT